MEKTKPNESKLEENLRDLYERVFKLNKPVIIIIDGPQGEGKTTKAVQVVDYINSLHGLPEMDLNGPQLGLGGEQFLDKIDICFDNKLPVIIYDEAGDFNRRGSLTKFNAMLNRVFEMFRAYRIIVVMCLPCFNVIDTNMFDNKVPRMLLNLYDRKTYGNYRVYGYDRMCWIKYKMSKLVIKSYAYGYVQPNFYGHFHDLEPERSKALDHISTAHKRKAKLKEKIKYEGLMTRKDIAMKLGKSPGTIKNTLLRLGQKPTRKLGREVYFSPDSLDAIKEYYEKKEIMFDDDIK